MHSVLDSYMCGEEIDTHVIALSSSCRRGSAGIRLTEALCWLSYEVPYLGPAGGIHAHHIPLTTNWYRSGEEIDANITHIQNLIGITVAEYHRNPVLSSFITHHPSGAHVFTPGFERSLCYLIFSFLCSVW